MNDLDGEGSWPPRATAMDTVKRENGNVSSAKVEIVAMDLDDEVRMDGTDERGISGETENTDVKPERQVDVKFSPQRVKEEGTRDAGFVEPGASGGEDVVTIIDDKDSSKEAGERATEFSQNEEGDYAFGELVLSHQVFEKLYPYQKDGIKWLWNLRDACYPQEESGGVLGDDMGLGKTIQVAAFLDGLFHSKLAKRVLIVSPLSVIPHWSKSLVEWAPHARFKVYHGTAGEKELVLKYCAASQSPLILLSTYGTVRVAVESLSSVGDKWDYIVLDEGHKIKGHTTDIAKAVRQIPSVHRILITGTPLQNNLRELWSLFDFVTHKKLFGKLTSFIATYEKPILRGHDADSMEGDRAMGILAAEELRRKIKPFFLRREKTDNLTYSAKDPGGVLSSEISASQVASGTSGGEGTLPRKKDLIIWIKPSKVQVTLYNGFLESEEVKEVLNQSRSALASLTVLKKICDHPWILSTRSFNLCGEAGSRASLGSRIHQSVGNIVNQSVGNIVNWVTNRRGRSRSALETDDADEQTNGPLVLDEIQSAMESAANSNLSLENSSKLSLVLELLVSHKAEGHHTLIFSSSTKMLDILQTTILAKFNDDDACLVRLDGSVPHGERQAIIDEFNDPNGRACFFLLSTGVGSLGLTVTRADRVIIYDPSWNPVNDNQAVDRAYRIGQKRNVLVYRLVTCGTIEEKIYKKQVFKGGLAKTATQEVRTRGFFSKGELSEVFTLHNTEKAETQCRFHEMMVKAVQMSEVEEQMLPFEPHLSWLKDRKEVDDFTHNDLIWEIAPNAIKEELLTEMRSEALERSRRILEVGADSFPLFENDMDPFDPSRGMRDGSSTPGFGSTPNRLSDPLGRTRGSTFVSPPEGRPQFFTPAVHRRRFVQSSPSESTPPTQGYSPFAPIQPGMPAGGLPTMPRRVISTAPINLDSDDENPPREPRGLETPGVTRNRGPGGEHNPSELIALDDDDAAFGVINLLDDDDVGAIQRRAFPPPTEPINLIDDDDAEPNFMSGDLPDSMMAPTTNATSALVTSGDYMPDSMMAATTDVLRTIRSINPRTNLSEEQMNQYDHLLERARAYQSAGNRKEELLCMFNMLDICDDDLGLQARTLQLCHQLGALPSDYFHGNLTTAHSPPTGELQSDRPADELADEVDQKLGTMLGAAHASDNQPTPPVPTAPVDANDSVITIE